jgi:hypothetical protein
VFITGETPSQERALPPEYRGLIKDEDGAIRKLGRLCLKGDLFSISRDSGGMQHLINRLRHRAPTFRSTVDLAPGFDERPIAIAPACGTWSVPGSERCHLVEKEQLGIASGCHQDLFAIPVIKRACDPILMRVGLEDPAVDIMNDAAVTHERSSG